MTQWTPQSTPPGIAALQGIKDQQQAALISKRNRVMTTEIAKGWAVASIEVSKTEKLPDGSAKRVSLGKVKMPFPTMAAISALLAEPEALTVIPFDGKAEDNDGIPTYANDAVNWVQSAIIGKVSIKMRNSLVPESVEIQAGKELPLNFEQLLEAAERTGEALKIKAEAVTAFAGYIAGLGKAPNVVETWKRLFRQPEAMASQTDTMKQKMLGYLTGFTGTLTPENMQRYMRALTAAEDSAKGESIAESDM